MTEFDQIIKKKIEEKEYPYSAASWHNFARKAGLKSALTVSHTILVTVLSVAVVAVGSWFGIRHFSAPKPVEPVTVVDSLPEEPAPVIVDSSSIENETVAPAEDTLVSAVKASTPRCIKDEQVKETPSADTVSKSKPVRKPILRPKNPRRILEIDPDTIKSNE